MSVLPRLLLVEDNRHALVAAARLLSSYDFDVEIARTVKATVTKVMLALLLWEVVPHLLRARHRGAWED
jgi:hypothetical protein